MNNFHKVLELLSGDLNHARIAAREILKAIQKLKSLCIRILLEGILMEMGVFVIKSRTVAFLSSGLKSS